MCGRFYIETDDTPAELMRLLASVSDAGGAPLARGEIRPGDAACVLAPDRERRAAKPFGMRWGYPLPRGLVINARLETAAERPLFRDSFRRRRCLIPASGWLEWDHREARPKPYLFSAADSPWLFLAGLYRLTDERRAEFTILTREPLPELRPFHDRMPLALLPEEGAAWLDGKEPNPLSRVHWTPWIKPGTETQLSFLEM
ncbi:MAG: SOS response-associated peptidase [Clostridia bacterium]|nr:SOS response-associated peptidase [Clostridia bacterium]